MGKNHNGNGRNGNAVIGHPARFVPPGHEIAMVAGGKVVYVENSMGTAPGRKEPPCPKRTPIHFATVSEVEAWMGR